jgi:hypothetical protein
MPRVKSQGRVPRPRRATLRQHLEACDRTEVIGDEMRQIVEQCSHDLLGELPPKMAPAQSLGSRRRR